MKKRIRLAILAALILIAAFFAVLFGCRLGENVTIGGLDVSGKTLWDACQAVRQEEDALQEKVLTINLPSETILLSPETWNIRLRTFSLVWNACRAGQPISLADGLRYNEKALLARLEEYAAKFDTDLTQSTYQMMGDQPALDTKHYDPKAPGQQLLIHRGTPERHIDIPAVKAAIEESFLEFRDVYELTLDIPAAATPDPLDMAAILAEFAVEPVNDSLDMETFQLVPGSYGYGFDLAAAEKALSRDRWGNTLAIAMIATAPEILGEEVYFRDELGRCETKHTDDENRNTNLRLVCKALDGLILQPGEEFSYNGTVGERTEEKGYKPAGAYSGNRLVKDIGGGVCQGSTTLYNCALLADLEIIERNGHGFTVNYVPIGLDAAVNWATRTDLRFRNNWHFPIMLKAEVSDGYMRMKILGTDEKDYTIKMTSGYSETELRIYANSYKHKLDKLTGEEISKELEARSSYMYMQ